MAPATRVRPLRRHLLPLASRTINLYANMIGFYVIVFLSIYSTVHAIPVDNGVAGEPEIECGPTSIKVAFNTQNDFEGHVYVKGRYAEQDCRRDATGDAQASIELPFETCGVSRQRSLNPKGVFVSVTVVISFHPNFITKVDRAITLQCFYMEADKTVSTDIEVSMITTSFQTQVVPMPICRYEILDETPEGEVLQYALIGQKAYHKWTCDSETVDTFCMTVHSCFVDDQQGNRISTLDENGCAVDRYVMGNLEYLTDLMAGVETHVFKYPDRAGLFFDCQITIAVKEPNGQCQRADCPEPRVKRDVWGARNTYRDTCWGSCLDVSSNNLNVLDVDPQIHDDRIALGAEDSETYIRAVESTVCLSTLEISSVFGALTVACIILTFFMFFVIRKKEVRLVFLKSEESGSSTPSL